MTRSQWIQLAVGVALAMAILACGCTRVFVTVDNLELNVEGTALIRE